MKILYLITARGGSKGVPNKNLREIAGLSLIGYKARAARKSSSCSRLVISSDSAAILDEARRHGVEVPFVRPSELASDTAKSGDVIAHAIEWFEARGEAYDAIMLLEPSAPFARGRDFDAAVALMRSTNANAVVGMRKMEVASVFVGAMEPDGRIASIVRKMKAQTAVLRQETKSEYTMNGALYLFKWDYFKKHRNIYHDEDGVYGYVMGDELSVEIDEMRDLHFAEFLVDKRYVDIAEWAKE
jgi:N-acylneuraminate cytidylyltransferase/CMP-N,N'-diacetyllegionaminic acid synthase